MLDKLRPCEGAMKKRKRVGRGSSSGHGGTSCRGHKGQNARSGGGKGPGFEGGQMPLQRRLPKRGFRNKSRRIFTIISLNDLDKFDASEEITPLTLVEKGIIKKNEANLIKVLSDGEIEKAISVKAHSFSKRAIEKIESAGGKIKVIEN